MLKEQGYEVIGVFMKIGMKKMTKRPLHVVELYEDMRRVCDEIGIDIIRSICKEYWDRVFTYFLEEYKKGRTPNPDVMCNKELSLRLFLDYAMKVGASYMATGHYARVDFQDGEYRLLRGLTITKTKPIFMYAESRSLIKTLFPIGI